MIAIENVRLFNETKEALEQQTATAEVLQVISSSVADTEPVFERILASTERLFECRRTAIFLAPGDGQLHLAAMHGVPGTNASTRYPRPFGQTAGPDGHWRTAAGVPARCAQRHRCSTQPA